MKHFNNRTYALLIMFIVSSLIFIGCSRNSRTGFDSNVELVREGSFFINQSVKIGDAFDQFFTNGEWRSFKSTNDEYVVEFTGYFNLNDHSEILSSLKLYNSNSIDKILRELPAKMMIQFIISGLNFEIQHIEINGVIMNRVTMDTIVREIIFSYKRIPSR